MPLFVHQITCFTFTVDTTDSFLSHNMAASGTSSHGCGWQHLEPAGIRGSSKLGGEVGSGMSGELRQGTPILLLFSYNSKANGQEFSI